MAVETIIAVDLGYVEIAEVDPKEATMEFWKRYADAEGYRFWHPRAKLQSLHSLKSVNVFNDGWSLMRPGMIETDVPGVFIETRNGI